MFEEQTVFILGAGASVSYGYPTGEELVGKVIDFAKLAVAFCRDALESNSGGFATRPLINKRHSPERMSTQDIEREWTKAIEDFQALADHLSAAHPLVIDYFLDHNPDLADVGKFCIAWAILQAERTHRQGYAETLNQQNWYRFILHKLTTGCLDKNTFVNNNHVSFITFNYDVSLDYGLYTGLSALQRFNDGDTIDKYLNGRIIHVYGKIRERPFDEPPPFDLGVVQSGTSRPEHYWRQRLIALDRVYEASQGLKVISPGKATSNSDEISIAKAMISKATVVYILGYGFDPLNSELLGLSEYLNLAKNRKLVMFTNLGNSGVINKRASKVLGTSANELMPDGMRIIGIGPGRVEKSINKVYDAMARDFDSPEDGSAFA